MTLGFKYISPKKVRKMIVDQGLTEGDACPGKCGGHLTKKRQFGVLWLQCSQKKNHYALA